MEAVRSSKSPREPFDVMESSTTPEQSSGLPSAPLALTEETGLPNQAPKESPREVGVGCSPRSFLRPTGITARKPPPKPVGRIVELFVFFSFVLLRAVHPIVIDESKINNEYPYSMESAVIFMTCSLALLSLVLCYAHGGKKEFATIWGLRPMLVFSINGVVYALGDYLEMASMSQLHGAAYQILMQSRIIITAGLMTLAKGAIQTRLQWTLLFILMFAMSTYMLLTTEEDGDANLPIRGMTAAALKVFVSCLGAVVSDKYMKVYRNDPTHVQIARIYMSRSVAIIALSFSGETWTKGFFTGWDHMTWAVTASFIVKSVSSLYIVALLDSILKNIAESFAVLVIYAYAVLAPWSAMEFDISVFLSVLVVVAACGAYIDSKAPVDKAKKWDKYRDQNAGFRRMPTML